MADRLKRAAAWLGLVTDDRYGDYDDRDETSSSPRGSAARTCWTTAREDTGNVTTLESRRPAGAAHHSPTAPSAPSSATGRAAASGHWHAADGPTATITPRTADMARITTVHPRTYNEARVIGEHFRDGVPVIMNLSEMEDADAKRLVDFAAGLIFGLRGTIERVTSKVFLLCPPNVNVSSEDKERIAGGFFNQS